MRASEIWFVNMANHLRLNLFKEKEVEICFSFLFYIQKKKKKIETLTNNVFFQFSLKKS
jgi:hypothetical protein